jgi:hypothetical protein
MMSKILNKVVTLFTAAFGVIAALAWDDAVKTMFQLYYPFPGTGIEAKFIYAVVVTIAAVCITTLFASLVTREGGK